MAKENREAGHMLGQNDPKKKTTPKQTEKQAQMRKGAANNDGSISQQAAQAMLGSTSCATHMRRALLKFADYVYTECYQRERGGEEKVHILLFSVAVQTTRNVKKKKQQTGAGVIWWCNDTNWTPIQMWRTLIIPLWHDRCQRRMEDEWRSRCRGAWRSLVPLLRWARQVRVTCSLTVSGASLAGRSWEFMAHSTTTTVTVLLAFWGWWEGH